MKTSKAAVSAADPILAALTKKGIDPVLAGELARELDGAASRAAKELPRWVWLLFVLLLTYGGSWWVELQSVRALPDRVDALEETFTQRLDSMDAQLETLTRLVLELKDGAR